MTDNHINNKKLSALLKILEKNKVTLFRYGEIEIHRENVDNDVDSNVPYVQVAKKQTEAEMQEAIDELNDLEDENLMITDPEEYERRLREDV